MGRQRQGDGSTATANFISGMMKSVPPMEDLFKMAGLSLPSYLKGATADAAHPGTAEAPAAAHVETSVPSAE